MTPPIPVGLGTTCPCPACGASLTVSVRYDDGTRSRCGDCRALLTVRRDRARTWLEVRT